MAINPEDEYVNTTPADSDYPGGSAKPRSTPGLFDGTPLGFKWLNDIWGFLQKLLATAGITANGNSDTVVLSQYYQSLLAITGKKVLNKAELKAITPPTGTIFHPDMSGTVTAGDGGAASYYWNPSDLSTEVTADPTELKYIAPTSDATGASGAYVVNSLVVDSLKIVGVVDNELKKQLEWDQYDLTIGNLDAGWISVKSVGVPYQTGNSIWRINVNIHIQNDTGSDVSTMNPEVTGVAWISNQSFNVAASANTGGQGVTIGGDNIILDVAINASDFYISGEVELSAKPSATYFPGL